MQLLVVTVDFLYKRLKEQSEKYYINATDNIENSNQSVLFNAVNDMVCIHLCHVTILLRYYCFYAYLQGAGKRCWAKKQVAKQ